MKAKNTEFIPREGLDREKMEALQKEIADKAVFEDNIDFSVDELDEQTVVEIDQAFLEDRVLSGAVVIKDGEIIERKYAVEDTLMPYIPGLLAFREGSSIVKVLEKLEHEPDLLVLDGSGRIHFRKAGIATHIGVIFDIPALGIAKNLLCGNPEASTEELEKAEKVPIYADNQMDVEGVIGYAVQTKHYDSYRINPVYVSPGHKLSEETAAELALEAVEDYKLPRPTYEADKYVGEVKEEILIE